MRTAGSPLISSSRTEPGTARGMLLCSFLCLPKEMNQSNTSDEDVIVHFFRKEMDERNCAGARPRDDEMREKVVPCTLRPCGGFPAAHLVKSKYCPQPPLCKGRGTAERRWRGCDRKK